MKAFVCYRQSDSRFVAQIVADFLRDRLGRRNVVVDVDSLAPGRDTWDQLEGHIRAADFIVVLVVPHWHPELLEDKKDWIRRELLLAFALEKLIIPVLHDGVNHGEVFALVPEPLRQFGDLVSLRLDDPPRHLEGLDAGISRALLNSRHAPFPRTSQRLGGSPIGLSTSEPPVSTVSDPELVRYTIVAVAERLLNEGATLVYAGLPPNDPATKTWNVTRRLQNLALDFEGRVVNCVLGNASLAEGDLFDGAIRVVPIAVNESAGVGMSAPVRRALDLRGLRRSIAVLTSARVCIGGRDTEYQGLMPGVAEEAHLALQAGCPTYLLGGFGGATAEMCKTLRGDPSSHLTRQWAFENCGTDYRTLVDELPSEIEGPGFDDLRRRLARGTSALNNGLTAIENDALMTTSQWRRAVELVLTGLDRLELMGDFHLL